MPILSLDWCCSCENSHHDDTTGGGQQENNGKIVTCGEDCKAFVWSYNKCKKSWVASQVFLQDHSLPLAPMCCQWNQTGDKILVGMNGGSKTACLTVCSFNNDLKEWTSLTIGSNSIKSAVLCVQWKPKTNKAQEDIVASGGCDFKCRVFSIGSMNLSIDSSAGDDGKERTR
jgi:WD domain, G-beta repeat.